MIKLLIFDYNGLLTDFPRERWFREAKRFAKKHKVSLKKQNELWNELNKSVIIGKISLSEAQGMVIKKMGLGNDEAKEWIRMDTLIVENFIKPKKFVKPTLKKLRKYKLAILSNAVHNKKIKYNALKNNNIKDFDAIFCSCDIGYEKPQKKAYFFVLNHFKVKPYEAVFIGHSKKELKGARNCKIKTIAVKGDKGAKADFYAEDFAEIPKILENIK